MMEPIVHEAISILRNHGLRVTEQRKAILQALAKSDSPTSAEETHGKLPKNTCDLVTAYRCLDQFEKAGVIELGVRENGTKVYSLSHGHHHHLSCRDCGRTEKIDLCMGKELEAAAKSFGFVEISHVMEVFGKCPNCITQMQTS